MSIVGQNSPEENRFKTLSDFKWCMRYHGDVEFICNQKTFSIVHPQNGILITQAYKQETEKLCDNADEVLEYVIDGTRLRDVITEVEVTDRTI